MISHLFRKPELVFKLTLFHRYGDNFLVLITDKARHLVISPPTGHKSTNSVTNIQKLATSFSHQHHFSLILSDPGTFEFTKPSFIIRESEGVLEVRIVKDIRYVYF